MIQDLRGTGVRGWRLRCLVAGVMIFTPSSRAGWVAAQQAGRGVGASARSGEFPRLLDSANQLSRQQDWVNARRMWDRIVEANPYVGQYSFALGTARLRTGDSTAAIRAFARNVELGGNGSNITAANVSEVAYVIARIHASTGRADSAFAWLERAVQLRLRNRLRIPVDSAFRNLADRARLRRLAGLPVAEPSTRVARWRADLAIVGQEILRMRPSLYPRISRGEVERELQKLDAVIPNLGDNEVIVRIQKILARMGDGHTTFIPEIYPPWSRSLPLQFEIYGDSVFIVGADSARASLVGTRVVRVGQHPIDAVIRTLDRIASVDNSMGLLRVRTRNLRYPQILNGLKLLPDPEAAALTVVGDDGAHRTVTVRVAAIPAGYNRLLGHPSWVYIYSRTPGPMPLYLRDRTTRHWFESIPEDRTVYLAFNSVTDDPSQSITQLAAKLAPVLERNDVQKLIVDLRWNNGGNSLLLPPLIDTIARSKVNQPGRLFVITSRYTYSAAMNATTFFERHTNAVFVGEPTPSSPNFVGESNLFTLPHTNLTVTISDLYWQSSWPFDRRTWVAPSLYAPLTRAAYTAKQDPALEAIRNYPARRELTP